MRKGIILAVIMLIGTVCSVQAQDNANSRQARRIFNNAYQQVFGEQGATLHYDVNITGIYKTRGTIWYKGKKSKFDEARMTSWNDGKYVYTFKKKKREVELHTAKNNKSDKYSQKFKFEPENYNYSIAEADDGLLVTLKLIKGRKGMKEIHALLERKTYHPISVRIKIAFIWTTIKISDFQSGGITDEMLRFPKEQFKDYKIVDKR
ncbi:LolA-like putative outer membrane lipoprotein chaperone [Xylanibacter ruminicola]|uniref:LolA-like putative outer membrane lipoprotein chaperone n=1 Tax=Xylanibacter ruminicola TaxID=839 RepID=UPI0018AF83E1|nr:LolA-like putative outer membrane lipoprotein chaperone [Xylanibacter ruminicola]